MKKILFVLLSAILLGLSRLPLYSGWLAFIGLIPLLYYFDCGKKNWKELLRDAFIFSAVNLTLWLHWISGVTASGFLGIIVLYTVYYYITFWAVQIVWQRFPKLKFVGFIMIFLTLEYLQNFGELRFPWTNLGYALADYTVLIQAADLGGVALLSLFLLLINVYLYKVMHKKWQFLIAIAALMLVWIGYGFWCFMTIPLYMKDARISIMQPSIPQELKWELENFDELYDRYVVLSKQAALDSTGLLIWPEAAMPAYILRDQGYLPLIQNLCDDYNLDIFTGFPDVLPAPADYPGDTYYYNAATLFKPYTKYAEPYYKMILVPVGERMPWLHIFPILWKLQFGQANWEYGKQCRYYDSEKAVFSPQICFEIAFAELNRKMAFRNLGENKGGKPEKIDFLVNITNDAWFGRSAGPWVHGMMSKFRAVENRIQIYRCANTGISMAVDPMGRIIKRTDLYEITLLKAYLYECKKIPLYYYAFSWTKIVSLLTFILILFALIYKRKTILKTRGIL